MSERLQPGSLGRTSEKARNSVSRKTLNVLSRRRDSVATNKMDMDTSISKESKYFCRHGKPDGSLVICDKAREETGAWPAWATAEKDGYIITPWYCENQCLWRMKSKKHA